MALTGAGISTESGIPDYRSPNTGLWENTDMSVVSLDGFLRDPSKYYDYSLKLYPIRSAAKPNSAHKLLGLLERNGIIKGVITQNVDGLHQDGGSENVHELHGSLRQAVCLGCNQLVSMEAVMQRVMEGQNPPYCEQCEGVLKPNAVFFGEALPQIPWKESVKLCESADLLIVIGSSLQVSPANILPDIAVKNGAKLVICNLQATPFDADADLIVREKIGKFSTSIAGLINNVVKDVEG
ncbi:MAG: NAD-dependent protein deacylase [Candidatus Dadabacteria bacterium]|nr:NAD-dependent protein deacylase [Candidatus Dadabacteria bacterium]